MGLLARPDTAPCDAEPKGVAEEESLPYPARVDKTAIKRWGILIGVAGTIIALAAAFLAWETKDAWLPQYVVMRDELTLWLKNVNPFLFFTLLAIVPLVPFPVSIFYVSCGIFPPAVGIIGILIALPVNLSITYWLSRTLLHPLAVRLLKRANLTIPAPSSRRNGILFSIFIRCCGTPFTLQNYIISLAGVSFRDYMIFGLPFLYIPAIAMMYLGNSLLNGKGRTAIAAIMVLVAVAVAAKLGKDYLDRRRAARGQSATTNV